MGASTTIFLGMVETPLLIKPYLLEMTRSELFSLMACGMASIAGTVMVLYSTILRGMIGGKAVTLQMLLGYVMAPIVWLFGIPWAGA